MAQDQQVLLREGERGGSRLEVPAVRGLTYLVDIGPVAVRALPTRPSQIATFLITAWGKYSADHARGGNAGVDAPVAGTPR